MVKTTRKSWRSVGVRIFENPVTKFRQTCRAEKNPEVIVSEIPLSDLFALIGFVYSLKRNSAVDIGNLLYLPCGECSTAFLSRLFSLSRSGQTGQGPKKPYDGFALPTGALDPETSQSQILPHQKEPPQPAVKRLGGDRDTSC